MPRKRPKKINIVDLETTCWEPDYTRPHDQQQEIIEIGIVVLNTEKDVIEIEEERSYLIKPEESTLSDFCVELTTITEDLLNEQGVSFEEAVSDMKSRYRTKGRVWASWGDFDRKMFERQCGRRNFPYPFGPRHLNLKCLYSILHNMGHEPSVKEALELSNLDFKGTPHRGLDDAVNIATIAKKMLETHKHTH